MSALLSAESIDDVNKLTTFLACTDTPPPSPQSVIVLAPSAVLHTATTLFDALSADPALTSTLIICGGIGHSTSYIYDAVAAHPRFAPLASRIHGQPESRVLERILRTSYPDLSARIDTGTLELLIDDRSTNCGGNAVESKRLLDARGRWPETLLVVQDPTMMRRTVAAFEKLYAGDESARHPAPVLSAWSTFVPVLKRHHSGTAAWDVDDPRMHGVKDEELWELQRYFDLVMGEIPRLRDDEAGYGPKGKGFIAHVDIPADAAEAWERLSRVLERNR